MDWKEHISSIVCIKSIATVCAGVCFRVSNFNRFWMRCTFRANTTHNKFISIGRVPQLTYSIYVEIILIGAIRALIHCTRNEQRRFYSEKKIPHQNSSFIYEPHDFFLYRDRGAIYICALCVMLHAFSLSRSQSNEIIHCAFDMNDVE